MGIKLNVEEKRTFLDIIIATIIGQLYMRYVPNAVNVPVLLILLTILIYFRVKI